MIETPTSQPEGKTLEFKRDLSSPRALLKTLAAFAKSAGGRLVIGVSDDRSIHGVADPLDEEERLANLIADSISPRLVPNVEMIEQRGSGNPGIFRQAVAENLPEPVIEELAGRLRFTVPLKQIVPLSREQSRATPSQGQSEPGSRPESGAQSGAQSISVLQALSAKPLSAADLISALGLKSRAGAFKRVIKQLLDDSVIEYTIPEKPRAASRNTASLQKGQPFWKDE